MKVDTTKFRAAVKVLKDRIVQEYNNDKRAFLETLFCLVCGLLISIGILVWAVLPIPAPHKIPTILPGQPWYTPFEYIKPTILHIMAVIGVIGAWRSFSQLIAFYLHPIISFALKVRDHYRFIKQTGIKQ